MTATEDIANIILGTGGSAVTIRTTNVEKIYNKTLIKITPPQSTANWASGSKDTKIVDLLRVELRFAVDGLVDDGDQAALEALFNSGGVFNMTWDGTSYDVNMDKLSITKSAGAENSEKAVKFTAVVGVNI
jgi:hypothetical protein